MLPQVVQDALNDQINAELSSSYDYLAMAAYCEQRNFVGCAHWLQMQSQEEYGHGMKLYNFMIARNGTVVLKEIGAPRMEYDSIVEVFRQALDQEIQTSRRIDALYELAFTEKSFAVAVELQWFINEQVEEEHTAREVLSKFELVKDDPSALLDLDRELSQRQAVDQEATQ